MLASSHYNLIDDTLYRDMVNSTAEQVSLALIQGNPNSNPTSPLGINNNPAVDQYILSDYPTLAWNDLLGMQTTVSNQNPPEGADLKFIVSPKGAQILRSRPRINTGSTLYPSFCMESYGNGLDLVNTVAGNETVISPCMLDNIAVSGVSGTLTSMAYGAFGEAVKHLVWGDNIEFLLDPYSFGNMSEIAMYTYLLMDFITPRPSLLATTFFQ